MDIEEELKEDEIKVSPKKIIKSHLHNHVTDGVSSGKKSTAKVINSR